MDSLKKVANLGSGGKGANTGGAGGQDYADKAFDAVSKKSGHDLDPKTDEKITDGLRSGYEKATGSKVSDKVSN